MNFPSGTNIDQAQKIAAQADDLASGVINTNFVQKAHITIPVVLPIS